MTAMSPSGIPYQPRPWQFGVRWMLADGPTEWQPLIGNPLNDLELLCLCGAELVRTKKATR